MKKRKSHKISLSFNFHIFKIKAEWSEKAILPCMLPLFFFSSHHLSTRTQLHNCSCTLEATRQRTHAYIPRHFWLNPLWFVHTQTNKISSWTSEAGQKKRQENTKSEQRSTSIPYHYHHQLQPSLQKLRATFFPFLYASKLNLSSAILSCDRREFLTHSTIALSCYVVVNDYPRSTWHEKHG